MSEYILTHKHHTHTHAASGWRIHCGVEVTELSTNKQHTLSQGNLEQDGLVCGRPDLVVKEVPAVLGQELLDRWKDDVQVLRASGQFS
jgi:hypothetical protein